MTHSKLASYLDATKLKLDATDAEICSMCDEAMQSGYAAVCVYPASVSICSAILYDSPVNVGTVIGFPHGRSDISAKREELIRASDNGAGEVEIVMNYAALRAGEKSLVTDELAGLCETARGQGALAAVIVETCYLNRTQKLQALAVCEAAGADFIKTSTGFGAKGAVVEDVALFAKHRTGPIKIKASGGIQRLEEALSLIRAGAERLGVSAAAKLMRAMAKEALPAR